MCVIYAHVYMHTAIYAYMWISILDAIVYICTIQKVESVAGTKKTAHRASQRENR